MSNCYRKWPYYRALSVLVLVMQAAHSDTWGLSWQYVVWLLAMFYTLRTTHSSVDSVLKKAQCQLFFRGAWNNLAVLSFSFVVSSLLVEQYISCRNMWVRGLVMFKKWCYIFPRSWKQPFHMYIYLSELGGFLGCQPNNIYVNAVPWIMLDVIWYKIQ